MFDATDVRRPAGQAPGRLVTALLLAAGLWLPAAALTSPAADAGTACDGVTVRVERPGSVREGCAPGAPGTGLDALTKAGFRYVFVDGQPGMVCSIDGYPDPCNGAPSDAYWAYYHAAEGATSWTYSTRGAGTRNPPEGSHEAWVFGAGARPSAPPPATAPEPTPSPSPPSPSPSPPKDGGGSGGSSGSGSGATEGAGSTDGSGSSRGSGSGGGSGSSGGSSTGGTTIEDAPRAGTSSSSTGGDAPPSSADGADAAEGEDTTSTGAADEDAPAGGPDDDAPDPDEDADDQPEDADDQPEGADGAEDATVRPEALDDTVTVDAPSGGRSGVAAAAGALLVVGLGAAGLLRSRRGDPDGEA